jgi:hypothetical protein
MNNDLTFSVKKIRLATMVKRHKEQWGFAPTPSQIRKAEENIVFHTQWTIGHELMHHPDAEFDLDEVGRLVVTYTNKREELITRVSSGNRYLFPEEPKTGSKEMVLQSLEYFASARGQGFDLAKAARKSGFSFPKNWDKPKKGGETRFLSQEERADVGHEHGWCYMQEFEEEIPVLVETPDGPCMVHLVWTHSEKRARSGVFEVGHGLRVIEARMPYNKGVSDELIPLVQREVIALLVKEEEERKEVRLLDLEEELGSGRVSAPAPRSRSRRGRQDRYKR